MWDSVADMAIVVAATLALLPLILTPHLLFYFDITPKIAVLLAGAAVAIPVGLRGTRVQSQGLRLLGVLLIAEAVSLALSTAFSTDRALSLGGSNWRRFGLVTQLALVIFVWLAAQWAAQGRERIRLILRVIAVAGIPAALYGISQYFGWDPLIKTEAYRIGEAPLTIVRPPGTLGYVSYFATYLLSVIFAGAALWLIEDERAWRWTGVAACALATAAMILTGTRAALVGLVSGALALGVVLRPRIRARPVVAAAGAVAVIAGFYFSPAGELLRSRTRWFVEDPRGGSRLLLWRDSLRMASVRLPLGWGLETFSPDFPRYQSAELARAYPDFYQESPHNIFLDALVSQGIPGFAILLGVTALGFYAWRKAGDRKLAGALGAGLVAILVSQQFTTFISVTAVYYYLTIALLVAAAFVAEPRPALGKRAYPALAISVAFVVFAVGLVAADAGLARVRKLIQARDVPAAVAAYQRVLRWSPPGMRNDLWYARAIGGAARGAKRPGDAILGWQQGLTAAVRAARSDEERQNAWYILAEFYAYQNDFPHTEESLRAAISCAPNWFKPHWVLARVLASAKRLDEARNEARRAVELDGGRDPEVIQTDREIESALRSLKK